MTKILILLGLVLTPFLLPTLAVLPIIPSIAGGTRPPKEFVALIFALAIFLSALFNGEIKGFTNKWYLIFLFYIPFAIWHSPPFITILGRHNIAGAWQWKPFCYIIIYTLLIVAISNINIKKSDIKRIFSVITVVGVLMALYVIVQKLNIEQFFKIKPYEIIGEPMEPKLMGTMGNSTLVSAFLVMCLPFCYYMRKWVKAAIIISAIIVCRSQMSIGTMIVCSILYSFILYPKSRAYLGTLCAVVLIGVTLFGLTHPKEFRSKIGDNSRFSMWSNTIKDIVEPPINQDINTPGLTLKQKKYLIEQNDRTYPYTGIGLGSYIIMYSEKHKEIVTEHGVKVMKYPKWGSPHNLYIHISYCLGIAGLGLFLVVLWTTLFPAFMSTKYSPDVFPIFMSVISVLVLSIGSFILEIEPTRLYAAVFMGLLLNKILLSNYDAQL